MLIEKNKIKKTLIFSFALAETANFLELHKIELKELKIKKAKSSRLRKKWKIKTFLKEFSMQIFALSQNMNFSFTFLTPTKSCVLYQVIQRNTIIFVC